MADLKLFPRRAWVPWPWRRWRILANVAAADEIPDRLPRRAVVTVGSADQPTWIVFDCPCRKRHRIMLNTSAIREPRWGIVDVQPLTLKPSIDDLMPGRRCHFFMRNGRIRWV